MLRFLALLSIITLSSAVDLRRRQVDNTLLDNKKPANQVKLEIFGEGLCPDTYRFFRNHLQDVWNVFGSMHLLDIRYHPFGVTRAAFCYETTEQIFCRCQHGLKECEINALQACIIKALPDPQYHINPVLCTQNRNNVSMAVQSCLTSYSGFFSLQEIEKCALSDEGRGLMMEHGKIQAAIAPELRWVPWIMINGRRNALAEHHLWDTLCNQYFQPRPAECDTRRPAPRV